MSETNETEIADGEAALVTEDGMTKLGFYLPTMEEGDTVPALALYLTACMIRARDEEFFQSMIDWMHEDHKMETEH